MDQTTRTLGVLAAAVLLVAPMVNGIMAEAASTADRLFLREIDYEGEPPDDLEGEPPEGPPPEDMPEDLPENGTAPRGAPQCTVQLEEEPAASWVHPDYSEDPLGATSSRSQFNDQQEILVRDRHVGMGVALNVTNLRGSMEVSVYDADDPENTAFTWGGSFKLGDSVSETSTHVRPQLTSGTWVAEINTAQATYDQLEFVVFLATCAEATG